jgi:hypothetical protein
MTVMRAETIRSGHTLADVTDEIKINAERSQEKRHTNAQKFLANCREQREDHERGLAAYKPLRENYPVQMLTIDKWK